MRAHHRLGTRYYTYTYIRIRIQYSTVQAGGEVARVKGKHISIYVPIGFKATWQKYLEICERDGTNAAKEIRQFVVGQVSRRDPGNPQRTLGTFVEGHEDEIAARRSDLVKELLGKAELQDGEVKYHQVLEAFKDRPIPGWKKVALTKSMISTLKLLGVATVY